MKKRIPLIVILSAVIILAAVLAACNGNPGNQDPTPEPTATPEPTFVVDPAPDDAPHYDVQRNLANEIVFTSDNMYYTDNKDMKNVVYTVTMDAKITNLYTGNTITVPCFWDGETKWVCRYAITEVGKYKYETVCSDPTNNGLHGQVGSITCTEYTGDLDIYKHGFIKTEPGKHYFMYADGTPFFYLGDTHWTLPMEKIDSYGGTGYGKITEETANQYGITSMFKYIMDYRANQGFTVIQSQQLATYTGISGNSWMGDARGDIFTYGVNNIILAKFQELDRYFAYIAELGLVHAHAQFAYPEELIEAYLTNSKNKLTDEQLEMLCRYWVARYSAYPVMWATAQEGDKDYYKFGGCTAENNPWILVFNYIQKYDPYKHPATCHQENVGTTKVLDSAFKDLEGYDFFAAQYSVNIGNEKNQNFDCFKEYWNNDKGLPAVNYEGRYDHFWGGTKVARTQGWCAYLNGMFGQGYGIQPIWSIFWASNGDNSDTKDEAEEFRRDYNWLEGLQAEGAQQLAGMRKFFEGYEWWNMVPCFDGNDYFISATTNYSAVTINGNEVYIAYYYGAAKYRDLGTFKGMQKGEYEIKWYNPRTCEYDETLTETVKITDGTYTIEGKPDQEDWVIVAKIKK